MNAQATEKARPSGRARYLPWLLVAVGVLAYCNSLGGSFTFDDGGSILRNVHIRRLWPIWETATAPPQATVAGRPVLSISLALNYQISKLNVWSYHAFNVAVHILAALVLFGIVRRTLLSEGLRERFGKASAPLALVCSLIWLVHPLQTESVTYIIQRAESLMGLFYLLTLYCVVRGASSPHRRRWHAAAIVSCALGMGTKEVMVTAPLIVLLYDRVFLARSLKEVFRRRWVLYAGLAGTWVILAALVWSGPRSESAGFTLASAGPLDYAKTQCNVIIHYLKLSFWPHPLVLDYDWPKVRRFEDCAPAAGVLFVLLGATLMAFRRWPGLGFLGVWLFVILMPSSSFVPIADAAFEHRMYLSLAALIVIVVVCAYALGERLVGRLFGVDDSRRRAAALVGYALAGAVVAVGVLLTLRRNYDYRSRVSIWSTVVQQRPNNPRGFHNLALALQSEGEYEEAISHYRRELQIRDHYLGHYQLGNSLQSLGRLDEAIREYHKVLRMHGDHPNTLSKLGMALQCQGKTDEAISHFHRALQIDPDHADANFGLGNALQLKGKVDEAISHYRVGLRSKSDYAPAHYSLGVMLGIKGKVDEAIDHYRQALSLESDYADAHNNLGNALQSQGRLDEAISHYRRAIEIKGDFADAHNNMAMAMLAMGRVEGALEHFRRAARLRPTWAAPLHVMAWILATHPNPNARDEQQAIRLAGRAAELTKYRNPLILDTLAAAQASAGQYDQAAETAQKAVELAQGGGAAELANAIRQRLELYKTGKPYREPL